MKTLSLDDICRVIDSANRELSRSLNENVSLPFDTWSDQARANMKESVRQVITGELRTPKDCHDKWLKDRVNEGWSFGEVKNFTLKTSPCIVDYQELPEEQKVKDDMFFTTAMNLGSLLREGEI